MKTKPFLIARALFVFIAAATIFSHRSPASTLSITEGQSAKIEVTADGTQPFTYQWRKNGENISGATDATYTISAATIADSANYSALVANVAGSTISDDAVLTVNAASGGSVIAPTITTQPTSCTVTAGQATSFSVTASGSATLTYQWLKNGSAISGATSSTYSIATTTAADAANYTVTITNAAGFITSSTAVLTVNPVVVAPTITTQPTSCTVTAGQATSFSVTASGSATLTYQWLKNGSAISGATASTFSIAATTAADAALYSVTISNFGGSVTSSSAVLTVNPVVIAPTITTQPTSLTVTAGQATSFSVAASGSATLTYQWLKNSSAISGATSSTYSIVSTTAADAANYSVTVTNAAGSVYSNSAILTVNIAPVVLDLLPQSYSARGQSSTSNGIAKLFDGQASTEWIDLSATTWVWVTFASPTVLEAYSFTSGNGAPGNDPGSWTVSGSNDGSTWTVIETRSAQTWSSRLLARDFILAAPSPAFTQFRFNLNSSSSSVTQLAELELFGSSVISTKLTPISYSARGQTSTYLGIAKLFDNKSNTKWQDPSATTWVKTVLAAPAMLRRYTLTSAADTPAYDPSSWTLSGSTDGTTWTVIETRTSQSWTGRRQLRDFVLAAPSAPFKQFRLDLKTTSATKTQLAELMLYGTP